MLVDHRLGCLLFVVGCCVMLLDLFDCSWVLRDACCITFSFNDVCCIMRVVVVCMLFLVAQYALSIFVFVVVVVSRLSCIALFKIVVVCGALFV